MNKKIIEYMLNEFNGNSKNVNEYCIKDINIRTNSKNGTVEIAHYNMELDLKSKYELYNETKHKGIMKWLGFRFEEDNYE